MEKQFRTESLQAAAFLLCNGAIFVACERVGINRTEFVFSDAAGTLQEQAHAYFNGATVIARRYYKNLGELRTAINKTMEGDDHTSRSLDDLKYKRAHGVWPDGDKGVTRG